MRHDTRSAALHHQRRVARRRLTHQIGAPISRIKRISATPIIPGQSTILHERPTPTTTFRESPGLVMAAEFMNLESMVFFLRYGSGIVCTPMTDARADALAL